VLMFGCGDKIEGWQERKEARVPVYEDRYPFALVCLEELLCMCLLWFMHTPRYSRALSSSLLQTSVCTLYSDCRAMASQANHHASLLCAVGPGVPPIDLGRIPIEKVTFAQQ
jgi:hypothetical protein